MWNKFKEGFSEGLRSITITSLVEVLIAVSVVYIIAWVIGEPANNVVGWLALGMAVGAGAKR